MASRRVVAAATAAIGGGIQVLLLPGHTFGSLALHFLSLDTVLTGDTVAELHGEVILGIFNVDREATKYSADRLAETGASRAGFGHGEPLLVDAAKRILNAADPFADHRGSPDNG